MTDKHSLHSPRNPAHLLGLGGSPALSRLLRACEADEACIMGCASDYNKFLALADAMPLCEGHPLRNEINAKLIAATGLDASLCPHTAHLFWERWTDLHWYGRELPPMTHSCPLCVPSAPTVVHAGELSTLPTPTEVRAPDLASWSAVLEDALPLSGDCILTLDGDYTFVRPNPYHADLAVRRLMNGEILTIREHSLLVTQALRVWGQALVKKGGTAPRVLLRGGAPEAVTALLAYLQASKALPSLVWLPHDPAHADAVSGLYRAVRTGYVLPDGISSREAEDIQATYAAVAPLGRAVILQ